VAHPASDSTFLDIQDSASTEAEMAKLEQLCTECDVMVTRRPKASFNAKDIQSSFETLLKNKSTLQHEHILERPLACSALAGVLKFAEIASDANNHGAPLLSVCMALHNLSPRKVMCT
jgi:hypothetical protein